MNGPHAITAMNVAPLCLHCFDQSGESVDDNAEGLLLSELSSLGYPCEHIMAMSFRLRGPKVSA